MYQWEKKKLQNGFNTWNTYSTTCFVHLPSGCALSIGFKEYLWGSVLSHTLIGQPGADAPKVFAGPHCYDGSYSLQELSWKRLKIRIESAWEDQDLYLRISLLENTTRFVPLCYLQGSVLWNAPGYCQRSGSTLSFSNRMKVFVLQGLIQEDPALPCQSGYLPLRLEDSLLLSTRPDITTKDAEEMLSKKSLSYQAQKNHYGTDGPVWEAMQTALAWNEIYEPIHGRITSNVSRLWNIARGGFGMFCWDNFFAAMMISLDDPTRGRANALEMLKEATPLGFVPNCSCGNGRKTFDRSQPPVGSFAVREIYRRDPQLWFLKESFPALYRWNSWWLQHRKNGPLLSWGSNAYDNRWEVSGIATCHGGALESGLDNSPMYDDDEITFDPAAELQNLWDVGLNSLYAYDCLCLADLAGVLEMEEERALLLSRFSSIKKEMNVLWDDERGFYYNYKTDTRTFSRRISPCNFYPLLAGIPTQRQFSRMMEEHFFNEEEFFGKWMLPSTARSDPAFADNIYWRGRIWAPLNFLVYTGLLQYPDCRARSILAEKSVRLLMREWDMHRHVHENYNATTGDGDDTPRSDCFYQWGGLLGLIGLIENGHVPGFGRPLTERSPL